MKRRPHRSGSLKKRELERMLTHFMREKWRMQILALSMPTIIWRNCRAMSNKTQKFACITLVRFNFNYLIGIQSRYASNEICFLLSQPFHKLNWKKIVTKIGVCGFFASNRKSDKRSTTYTIWMHECEKNWKCCGFSDVSDNDNCRRWPHFAWRNTKRIRRRRKWIEAKARQLLLACIPHCELSIIHCALVTCLILRAHSTRGSVCGVPRMCACAPNETQTKLSWGDEDGHRHSVACCSLVRNSIRIRRNVCVHIEYEILMNCDDGVATRVTVARTHTHTQALQRSMPSHLIAFAMCECFGVRLTWLCTTRVAWIVCISMLTNS